tara:strand:- start:560 stop:940 length:381 start_codon:yes stop_codon:yes gene_type:complete
MKENLMTDEAALIGTRVAVRILLKWQATDADICAILDISPDTLRGLLAQQQNPKLEQEPLERVGLILNIHAVLRTVFSNPANVYGFMQMVNNNAFFCGRAPLTVISDGNIESLRETYRRIKALEVE